MLTVRRAGCFSPVLRSRSLTVVGGALIAIDGWLVSGEAVSLNRVEGVEHLFPLQPPWVLAAWGAGAIAVIWILARVAPAVAQSGSAVVLLALALVAIAGLMTPVHAALAPFVFFVLDLRGWLLMSAALAGVVHVAQRRYGPIRVTRRSADATLALVWSSVRRPRRGCRFSQPCSGMSPSTCDSTKAGTAATV